MMIRKVRYNKIHCCSESEGNMFDLLPLNKSMQIKSNISSLCISSTEAQIIYNFIVKIFRKEIETNIKVDFLLSAPSLNCGKIQEPSYRFDKQLLSYIISDDLILCKLLYHGTAFYISIFRYVELVTDGYPIKRFQISSFNYLGMTEPIDMVSTLREISIQESIFTKRILRVYKEFHYYDDILNIIEIVEPKKINLNEIYIPDIKKEQCHRFIKSVLNYEYENCALRYLFNGNPGTAKTQLINAIINELYEKVCIFILSVGEVPLIEVFNFVNRFDKCVLVIDDLDLIVGDREKGYDKKQLAMFLSTLDGYIPNNLFLLASTNDKKLVDIAASRPGRFDIILDIDTIDKQNYESLIKRETKDPQIISLFTDTVLDNFAGNKVTGAYIVSLIKQLKNIKYTNGNLTQKDFEDYLKLTYNGFYKSNGEDLKAVGF